MDCSPYFRKGGSLMPFESKTPAAEGPADRGRSVTFGVQRDSSETTQSGQLPDTLTVTIRRHIETALTVWVHIQRLDGTVMRLRPGPLTAPEDFAEMVEEAKAILRRGAS